MILIIGGTTEGRAAIRVIEKAEKTYYYSTKGDKQSVECPHGVRLTGGMDAEEMVAFCHAKEIKLIINAAHPFASLLHRNVSRTSERLGIPVIRFERMYPERDERFVWCDSFDDAIRKLKARPIKKLLALSGVNTIAPLRPYWETRMCWFRILDREESLLIAQKQGFPKERLVFLNEKDDNSDLIERLAPDAILTKESGYSGSFEEKTNKALELGVSVFVIKRPTMPSHFINVYGEVGLRIKTERLLTGFFALRMGFTTGVYATAAAKAALIALITQEDSQECVVRLPSSENSMTQQPKDEPVVIAIVSTDRYEDKVCCTTIKDAGDDPDATNKARIKAEAFWADESAAFADKGDIILLPDKLEGRKVVLRGGKGIGTVTLPGLGIDVGEPAINATPRRMIQNEIESVLGEYPTENSVLVITISIPDGEEIAKRTFNPKLGIKGGISIIGTSGIVRPFSNEAFIATIQKEIEIAKATECRTIVINSGAKSERFLKRQYSMLPAQAFIHYGNFIGETLALAAENEIPEIVMGIMIGKAVKLAEGALDTHSRKGTMNKPFIKALALSAGCGEEYVRKIDDMNLARELWHAFPEKELQLFRSALISKCREQCSNIYNAGILTILLISEEK